MLCIKIFYSNVRLKQRCGCSKGGNGAGWASEDVAAVEDEEECRVTNIDEDTRAVQCTGTLLQ